MILHQQVNRTEWWEFIAPELLAGLSMASFGAKRANSALCSTCMYLKYTFTYTHEARYQVKTMNIVFWLKMNADSANGNIMSSCVILHYDFWCAIIILYTMAGRSYMWGCMYTMVLLVYITKWCLTSIFFFVALAAAGVEDCRPNLHVPLLSISHHNDTDDSARHA